jgi:hypothetical protein
VYAGGVQPTYATRLSESIPFGFGPTAALRFVGTPGTWIVGVLFKENVTLARVAEKFCRGKLEDAVTVIV